MINKLITSMVIVAVGASMLFVVYETAKVNGETIQVPIVSSTTMNFNGDRALTNDEIEVLEKIRTNDIKNWTIKTYTTGTTTLLRTMSVVTNYTMPSVNSTSPILQILSSTTYVIRTSGGGEAFRVINTSPSIDLNTTTASINFNGTAFNFLQDTVFEIEYNDVQEVVELPPIITLVTVIGALSVVGAVLYNVNFKKGE